MKQESDKRERILQAALTLIAERGFHATPMAMIAEEAGVAAGTIYRYFESKDLLITELHNYLSGKMRAALLEGYEPAKPIQERFSHLCSTFVGDIIKHPLEFGFMEQYFNSPFGVSLRRDKILGKATELNPFLDLVQEGISRGILKDLPFYVMAAFIFTPLVSLVRDHNLGLIKLDQDIIQKSIEACWDSLKLTQDMNR